MTTKVWSRSRLLVQQLMEKLEVVREIEGTDPSKIPFVFGNLEAASYSRPSLITWLCEGGVIFDSKMNAPSVKVTLDNGGDSTILAMGYRRCDYLGRIWMDDQDQAEVVLDQLSTASRLIPRSDQILIANRTWKFPTELQGRWNETGSCIDASIGFLIPIAKDAIGGVEDVVVQGSEFRAGISMTGDLADPNAAEFDVDRLTSAWTG